MLEHENGLVRAVAWTEICPWLKIFQTFRLAISLRVLLLGALGAFLTMAAWAVLGHLFHVSDPATTAWMTPGTGCPWNACAQGSFWSPTACDPLAAETAAKSPCYEHLPLLGVWMQLSRPVWAAFEPGASKTSLLCLFLCGLSSLAIWAFFGTAIARIAAVQLAADERVGFFQAMRFAASKWLACFTAPLWPIAGICVAAAPIAVLGLLMRVGPGLLLVSFLWPVFLALAALMAVLLIGALLGWPLMWSTVATEGTDSFDALSRCYAYTFQRPLHYLFYVVVAALFGALGWALIAFATDKVIDLAYWAAAWGCSADKVDLIRSGSSELTGLSGAGASVIRFWTSGLRVLALGFVYGYFWTAAVAIYLLLRRDVDATETDEVFLDADGTETAPPLAPITTDVQGAPEVELGTADDAATSAD